MLMILSPAQARGASRGDPEAEQPEAGAGDAAAAIRAGSRGNPRLRCAAPAASPRTRSTGRFRDPTRGAIRPLCEELAGQAARGLVRCQEHVQALSLHARGPMTSIGRVPGSADPGTEIAAMERREAPAFSKRERGLTERPGAPLGAPSPRAFCGGRLPRTPCSWGKQRQASPAPRQTTRAMTLAWREPGKPGARGFGFSPPHPEERAKGARLEGGGGHAGLMVRDAPLTRRSSP
jgi:hypothetical protein